MPPRRTYLILLILLMALPLQAQQSRQGQSAGRPGATLVQRDSVRLMQRAETLRRERDRSYMKARALAREKGWVVSRRYPDGRFIELQGVDDNNMPVYYETHNANAAITTSTNDLMSGGSLGLDLDGSGLTLGIWDAGAVRSGHQEFSGRVVQGDTATIPHFHATHVAGTLVGSGVDPNAKGMAPGASLDAYDWGNDESEMAIAAASGLLLSNHSYGTITGWSWDGEEWDYYGDTTLSYTEDYKFGFYHLLTRQIDEIAYDAPYYLIVKSAGNDRDDGPGFTLGNDSIDGDADGFDCISIKGVAKNVLTVGAVGDLPGGYAGNPGDVSMADFSSWGPSDDGRIKPDICGNGISLYSSLEDADDSYAWMSGTSMSSPNVAGSLLLLQEHFQEEWGATMRAATLKGLAIHTADEAGPAEGPDYMYGWGLLNAETAAGLISDRKGSSLIEELELANGEVFNYEIQSAGSAPLTVTISWTDPAGNPVAKAIDPPDLMLVNDLDIQLTQDVQTFRPYVLDPLNPQAAATTGDNDRDNVEKVVIPNPSGRYTLQVSHEGSLTNGSQHYSLIVSGLDMANGEISLTEGWNMLSLPVQPLATDMEAFFGDLLTGGQVEKVMDESGNALEYVDPVGWVNGIGDFQPGEGYKIRVSTDTSLTYFGTPAEDPMIIDLRAGWNIISYPWSAPSAASAVFNDLQTAGQLLKVQDETGNAFEELPSIGWIDNIGQLQPGKAFKVRVNSDTSLTVSDPE